MLKADVAAFCAIHNAHGERMNYQVRVPFPREATDAVDPNPDRRAAKLRAPVTAVLLSAYLVSTHAWLGLRSRVISSGEWPFA